MAKLETQIAEAFVCDKCDHQNAHVEKLAMSGTGLSRLLELQLHRYAFVSCKNCGYTEVFNLKVLQGRDDLGSILEILFLD